MAFVTPKQDWAANDVPTKDDFNRIEGNTKDLDDTKLDLTGDGKDVTVIFTEGTNADIASGEKLSVLFGKILARIKAIVNGTTTVGKSAECTGNSATANKLKTARNINGVAFDGSANITVADGTKAPTSHASSVNTYGLGTTANYGHCKTINDLLKSAFVNGEALSAYQGKVLNDKVDAKIGSVLLTTVTVSVSTDNFAINLSSYFTNDYSMFMCYLDGTISLSNTHGSQTQTYIIGLSTSTNKVSPEFKIFNQSLSSGSSYPSIALNHAVTAYTILHTGSDFKDALYLKVYIDNASYVTVSGNATLKLYGIKLT